MLVDSEKDKETYGFQQDIYQATFSSNLHTNVQSTVGAVKLTY
jgi:hypothetical protein